MKDPKPNLKKAALEKILRQKAKNITFPIARIIILMMETTAGPKLVLIYVQGVIPLLE
jgi:hypothetical protein